MKLRELLEYLNEDQLIMIQLNGLKSDVIKIEEISQKWLENKVKSIATGLSKGYEVSFINVPDKSFVKIEIE